MGSPRLFNRIRADRKFLSELAGFAATKRGVFPDVYKQTIRMLHFPDTQVIVADNICRYYMDNKLSEEVHDLSDPKFFPCVTPPFPRMFIEHEAPPDEGIKRKGDCSFVGIFFDTTSNSEDIAKFREYLEGITDDTMTEGEAATEKQKFAECTWLIRITFYIEQRGEGNRHVDCVRFLALDENGRCSATFTNYDNEILRERLNRKGNMPVEEYVGVISSLLHIPLLAISFMHCKNVQILDARPEDYEPPKWTRRMKVSEVKYKTLQIEPVRKILEGEGNLGHNGFKKALHICRGHFARYTEDKPLFGRVVGRIWRPAHVRGSSEQGRVEKDYDVQPPPEEKGDEPSN